MHACMHEAPLAKTQRSLLPPLHSTPLHSTPYTSRVHVLKQSSLLSDNSTLTPIRSISYYTPWQPRVPAFSPHLACLPVCSFSINGRSFHTRCGGMCWGEACPLQAPCRCSPTPLSQSASTPHGRDRCDCAAGCWAWAGTGNWAVLRWVGVWRMVAVRWTGV